MSLGLGVGLASASSLIGDSALVLRNWSPDDVDTYLWLDGSDVSTQSTVGNATSYIEILSAHNGVDQGEILVISFQDQFTVNGDTPDGTVAFDPADQGTLWDYVTPNEITQWNDKSGRANHMLASGDPPTTLATLNGLSVLDFKESGGYMSNTTQSLPAGRHSWFAVFRPDAPLGNLGGGQFGTSSMLSYGTFNNNTWQVQSNSRNGFSGKVNYGSSASGDPNINPNGGTALGNYAIWGWSFNQHLISTRFNGTQTNTNHSDANHSAPVANQRIGVMANRGLNTYLDGRMAEVICIDNETLINQQIVEGYLAHKWDLANLLPNTHPFKNTRPMVQDGVINFLVDEDGDNILDQGGNPIVV